jgi:chromosome partitioning protein
MSRTEQCPAFIRRKGGRGKTTWCPSIAGYLAKSGNKVLVVNFDPQANATSGLGIDLMVLERSMYDAVLDRCDGHEGVPITRVILETDVENLHVAPSEFDLGVAELFPSWYKFKEMWG